MSFWDIFIACLTGAGAMTAAVAVIGLTVWGLICGGAFLFYWIADAIEGRFRR